MTDNVKFRRRRGAGYVRLTVSLEMAVALHAASQGEGLHHWGGGYWLPSRPPRGYWRGDRPQRDQRCFGTQTIRALVDREMLVVTDRAAKTPGMPPLAVGYSLSESGRGFLEMLPALAPEDWPQSLGEAAKAWACERGADR